MRTPVRRCLYLLFVCVLACALGSEPARGGPAPDTRASLAGIPVTQAPKNPRSLPGGTYDAGEVLRIGQREIRLLRARDKVAVIHTAPAEIQAAASLDRVQVGNRQYALERYISKPRMTILRTRNFASLADQTSSMQQLEQQTAAGKAVPVYIHEPSGLEMVPTGKLVLKVEAGRSLSDLAAVNGRLGTRVERRIRGTTDQYILSVPHGTAGELFETCDAMAKEPAVEWAEPDFISQTARYAYEPNDPLFASDQWYLEHINAPQAWDITTAGDQIIVAVIDDGMDLRHEDLLGALPSNAGETPDNERDDDLNGWKDDVSGWDFHDDDNDPSPGDAVDNHGTQVAGLIGATGNNGKGIAGCAFGCKLMPLKVLRGDPREEMPDVYNPAIAESLYYAAGRTEDGKGRWRGADIISISLGFPEINLINTALQFAVKQGRNGKGCPTFCASGNDASGWMEHRLSGFPADTYHFRWELARDRSGSAGDNTVWLDSILWPGGTVEQLGDEGLPAGWRTGGDARWVTVQNDAEGNHVMGGWADPAARALRPQAVDHGGRSYLDVKKTVGDGDLSFYLWDSLEESYPALVGDYGWPTWDLYSWTWPFFLGFSEHQRMQFICLREELGWDRLTPAPVRKLKFAEFHIFDPPAEWVDEITIRVKHIHDGIDCYRDASWDAAGWTTVFHGRNVPLSTGTAFDLAGGGRTNLIRFDFTKEFTYDPNYNLAVDISTSESNRYAWGGFCMTSTTQETRAIVGGASWFDTTIPPTDWNGAEHNARRVDFVPVMWLGSGDEMRFFVDGQIYWKTTGVYDGVQGISYPASYPDTAAVGASSDFGLRSDYSQYGPDLDFVAPSSGGRKQIASTDRTGSEGSDFGNYSHTFGGTSAATPLASGVAALMLSENPNLTADQVRTLMRQTCQKIGDDPYVNDRNDQYGYGRIDAAAAVSAARAAK